MSQATNQKLLTIAGSDSGGGAGIQADLKTFMALGCYGSSVITAVTSQNTLGVDGIVGLEAEFVAKQLRAVLSDVGADAIKIGMLYSLATVASIASVLASLQPKLLIVLDPVMITTTGHSLTDSSSEFITSLIENLLPIVTLVTPNLPEAEKLSGFDQGSIKRGGLEVLKAVAHEIRKRGARNVLIKGGHMEDENGEIIDVLLEEDGKWTEFKHKRIDTPNNHGTGCTLSSAIASYLAKGHSVAQAISLSTAYVISALSTSFSIGSGPGPLNHLCSIVSRAVPLPTESDPYPFTRILIERNQSELWDVYTKSHPFVRGVRDGSLSRERFQWFLRQDYIFLTHYARIHALAAYKCDSLDEIEATMTIVGYIVDEAKKHIKKCKAYGISEEDFHSTPEGDMTVAYTRFVLDVGSSKSLLHLRVAVVACLLGYAELGLWMKREIEVEETNGLKKSVHPYREWIWDYGGDEFQEAAKVGKEVLEKSVKDSPLSEKELQEMVELFGKATKLEIGFWQQAWDMK